MSEERKDYLIENLRDTDWYQNNMWKRGLSNFPPAIITNSLTGGNNGKESNPNLPETVDEQVESAYESYKAGAAMVHIHTRVPDQLNVMSWDPELYIEVNTKIREKCPDLIINNTNICGRWIDQDGKVGDWLDSITEASAEVGSIDVSCYYSSIPMKPRLPDHPDPWSLDRGYVMSPTDCNNSLEKMKKYGVKPEFECFSLADVHYLRRMLNSGWKDWTGGPAWLSLVLTGGSTYNTPTYLQMLKEAVPSGTMVNVIATGAQQWAMSALALVHGFNIRVGMEDSTRLPNGKLAASNADLVDHAIALANAMGRKVATIEQARTMLGLGAPRTDFKSNFVNFKK